MSKRTPIPKVDAADAWPDVLSRAFQSFAFYHWWSLAKSHPSFPADASCTVKNAALESSLMSIRDLDDFFLSSPKARQDDLIAADYGFPSAKNFLTSSERDAINKKLTHLTYLPTHERQQNPPVWNNAEIVNRAVKRLLEFLDHLECSFFAGNAVLAGTISTPRTELRSLLTSLNNVPQSEMNFPA